LYKCAGGRRARGLVGRPIAQWRPAEAGQLSVPGCVLYTRLTIHYRRNAKATAAKRYFQAFFDPAGEKPR
jgi:hypothetical protein